MSTAVPTPADGGPAPAGPLASTKDQRISRTGDAVLRWAARGSAFAVLLMLAVLVSVLAKSAAPSIQQYGANFLVASEWRPNELERPLREVSRYQDGRTARQPPQRAGGHGRPPRGHWRRDRLHLSAARRTCRMRADRRTPGRA